MADLSPATKAKKAALQNALQGYIDELTAQREKAVVLVKLIPDQTARTVLELRYGLIGSGCELMPYKGTPLPSSLSKMRTM